MPFFKYLVLMTFVLTSNTQARVENSEDVLSTVSQKLDRIDRHLKDQRIFVRSATFEWPDFNNFRNELMFVVAHDPTGPIPKETPSDLMPSYLTQKLKDSLFKFETSVNQIGNLVKKDEWNNFKIEMDKFLRYRDEFLYVPARALIKSGALLGSLDRVKEAAGIILKTPETTKHISVRVVDPLIEDLTQELNLLNHSVRQLEAFNRPAPVEVKTAFQEKYLKDLGLLTIAAMFLGFLGTVLFQWSIKKLSKPKTAPVAQVNPQAFDYYEWLKSLEVNLKTFKSNEEQNTEDHINLKNLCRELHDARKGLNLAENQQDYYVSLEQLNSSAPKLEEYFEKMNIKKNAEVSRRMIKVVIQLCEAIESRHEISLKEGKGKLKATKLDPHGTEIKAA